MGMASELSRRLSDEAEAVCRAYLPNGRRSGRYWIVGNVAGERGRSLFVKLWGDRRGRWQDGATGEYGDLLDLIRLNRGFNGLPRSPRRSARLSCASPRRIYARRPGQAASRPRYPFGSGKALRHLAPRSRHRSPRPICAAAASPPASTCPPCAFIPPAITAPDESMPLERWPALLGAVTDLDGDAHRPAAHLARPRRGRQGPD